MDEPQSLGGLEAQLPQKTDDARKREETRTILATDFLSGLNQMSPLEFGDTVQSLGPEHIERWLDRASVEGRDRTVASEAMHTALQHVQYAWQQAGDQKYRTSAAQTAQATLKLVITNITNQRQKEREQGLLAKVSAQTQKIAQNKEKERAEFERLTLELQATNKQLEEANIKLTELAYKDPLTKCYNKGFFDTQLPKEIEESRRHNDRPLSLIYLDLDGYKRVNDTFGHVAGDHVLRDVAKTMAGVVQERRTSTDLFCRPGGDEFTLLLPVTDEAGAVTLAERILATIKNTQFKYVGNAVPIGVTLGVAQHIPGEDSERLYLRADKALYVGKEWGRSRIVTDSLLAKRLRESKEFPEKLMADYKIFHPALKEYYFGIKPKDTDLKRPKT